MRIDRAEWGRLVKIRKLVPNLLFKELKQVQGVIGLGTMTDPYQPIERSTGLTRRCLEQIARSKCRVSVHTKSDLVVRDIDIIGQMEGAEVGVTITTHDDTMALVFEPHAPPPRRRLDALRQLLDAGIDAYALIAPMIPMVTDSKMEGLMDALHSIGLKKVIIDRLRPRQGMIEHLNALPVFDEKLDFHLFKEKAHSTEYFIALEGRISTLCHEKGIECVSAF
jgi:DNA repair photolyase